MQTNRYISAGFFFLEDDALGEAAQSQRRWDLPSDRDEKQLRGNPMPFRGDGGPDEQGERPPLAWTLIRRENTRISSDTTSKTTFVDWDM